MKRIILLLAVLFLIAGCKIIEVKTPAPGTEVSDSNIDQSAKGD